jgi:hypothetical protein
MLFRLQGSSCGSSSSGNSSVPAREVRRRFRALALTVHPDKVPQEV